MVLLLFLGALAELETAKIMTSLSNRCEIRFTGCASIPACWCG